MEICRWPWLSREDADMLRALPDDAAREMAALLRAQARSDRRFRETIKTLRDEDLANLEASRRIHSGKRARQHPGGDEDDTPSVASSTLTRARSRYEWYLTSEHWKDVKRRYRRSDLPQDCLVCGAEQVELHHLTYARLGRESIFDLAPLCSEHYQQVHDGILSLQNLAAA